MPPLAQAVKQVSVDKERCSIPTCKNNPVVVIDIPQGCVVVDDPVQALCMQHWLSVQSTGTITVIEDLTVEQVIRG